MSIDSTVEIDGLTVDINAPCDVATALKRMRLMLVANEAVRTVRFGQDEVTYSVSNVAALDREIERYDRACATITPGARRRRFAKTIRF